MFKKWLSKNRTGSGSFGLAVTHIACPLSRTEKLLSGCDMDGTGLEIGASYGPVAPKKAGYRVEILDHAPADILREKYKGLGSDIVGNIEDVDYIWTGEPLHELTGKQGYYNWIIASHVIEHTPDLISFLNQCETMLKADGTLCLAIPDHRYCFDFFRPVSTPGSVIQAYVEQRNRHSVSSIYDYYSLMVQKGGKIAWHKGDAGEYEAMHPCLSDAQALVDRALADHNYLDVHNWVFTPASFRLIMNDIRGLGYTRLSICNFFPVEGCEFIVQMKKTESGSPAMTGEIREQLLLEVHYEHKEAVDCP